MEIIHLLPPQAVESLRASLSEKRYLHSVSVMETAFQLADAWEQFPVDRTALAWASLFHDCGKEIPKEERMKLCNNGFYHYGKELLEINKLNHAPLGAYRLQKDFGIEAPDILMAVAYHPTGHPDLTPIGWMVYIADFLEPGRTYFKDREKYLRKACGDPLKGMKQVTKMRLNAIREKNKPPHPLTLRLEEYLNGLSSL